MWEGRRRREGGNEKGKAGKGKGEKNGEGEAGWEAEKGKSGNEGRSPPPIVISRSRRRRLWRWSRSDASRRDVVLRPCYSNQSAISYCVLSPVHWCGTRRSDIYTRYNAIRCDAIRDLLVMPEPAARPMGRGRIMFLTCPSVCACVRAAKVYTG